MISTTTENFKLFFYLNSKYWFLIIFLGRYFDEISQDTGKYCFGVEDTLKALEMGSVEILIAWENLDIVRYILKNHATDGKLCIESFYVIMSFGAVYKSHYFFNSFSTLMPWLKQGPDFVVSESKGPCALLGDAQYIASYYQSKTGLCAMVLSFPQW